MTDRPIPNCPIRGCENEQCEPLVVYVCDDHAPKIEGKRLRAWMIEIQERLARAEGRP